MKILDAGWNKNIFFHKQLVLVCLSLFLGMAFYGCYTAKKAVKQINKAKTKQPLAAAKEVAKLWPIIENSTIDTIVNSKDYDSIANAFRQYQKENELQLFDLQKQIGAALGNPNCAKQDELIERLNNALIAERRKGKELSEAPKPIVQYKETVTKESSATAEVIALEAKRKLELKTREYEDKLRLADIERLAAITKANVIENDCKETKQDLEMYKSKFKSLRKNYWLLWLVIAIVIGAKLLWNKIKIGGF